MRTIIPLHSRANVIPRADLHAKTHEMLHEGGVVDSAIWGKIRLDCTIQYNTPAPRNSFAFGEVATMGLPLAENPRSVEAGKGDIIGFDLHQTGHQLDAAPYYENATVFYTLPWKEILCRFVPGEDLPRPVGDWCMVEKSELETRRLVLASAGSTLHLGVSAKAGVATNKGRKTNVKLVAGSILAFGSYANVQALGAADAGDWALFNPIDGVDINYTQGRQLTFIRWSELEQLVPSERAGSR
jgi:hypothetical protein